MYIYVDWCKKGHIFDLLDLNKGFEENFVQKRSSNMVCGVLIRAEFKTPQDSLYATMAYDVVLFDDGDLKGLGEYLQSNRLKFFY